MAELRPVKQTRFDAEGNCFEACLASILGVAVADVPHQPAGTEDHDFLLRDLNDWLATRGWQALTMPVTEFNPGDALLPDSYWIAHVEIPTTDAWYHAIVCRGLEIVFDPDDRGSVPALTAENLKQMTWLVPKAEFGSRSEFDSLISKIKGEVEKLRADEHWARTQVKAEREKFETAQEFPARAAARSGQGGYEVAEVAYGKNADRLTAILSDVEGCEDR